MGDAFSRYHPLVNFLFFALVLAYSMVLMHPVCLAVSLTGALVYAGELGGRRALAGHLKFALPVLLLAAIVNPAFNHAGVTILTYLPSGNPLTLESILYGLAAGAMLCAVVLWFVCFNAVITSDKFVYLFGRVIPALSLVLSMTLRFVPLFRRQLEVVRQAQFCIGRDASCGSVWQRVRRAVTIFSIMVTWALENAIETADSMKSRGYGLRGRTAFSIYRMEARDRYALAWLGFCGLYLLCGCHEGLGRRQRGHPLYTLVPASDRRDGGKARRIYFPVAGRRGDHGIFGEGADQGGTGRVLVPVRRTPGDR